MAIKMNKCNHKYKSTGQILTSIPVQYPVKCKYCPRTLVLNLTQYYELMVNKGRIEGFEPNLSHSKGVLKNIWRYLLRLVYRN